MFKKRKNKNNKKKIAIVGDGLASAICIRQLEQEGMLDYYDVDIYAKSDDVGRGEAYASDTPDEMLLNHPIRGMRFSDDTGQELLKYVSEHYKENASLLDFIPRRVFGDFVHSNVKSVFNECSGVSLYKRRVRKIYNKSRVVELGVRFKRKKYDHVIMCVGSGQNEKRLGHKWHFDDDYSGQSIAIVGASLSAIDIVNMLTGVERVPPKKIILFQRNAGFRMVRPNFVKSRSAELFTHEWVNSQAEFTADSLMGRIQQEVNKQGISYDFFSGNGLYASTNFNEDLQEVLERLSNDPDNMGDHPEYALYETMLAIIIPLMRVFEEEKISSQEADKFRQEAEKTIFAFLAPMPPHIASKLSGLLREGRLVIENGKDCAADVSQIQGYDKVIDARGMNRIVSDSAGLPNFFRSNRAVEFSKLGGISYDPKTSQMRSVLSKKVEMPYIVGQLKKGQQFDCSESQVIYWDCQKVIADIKKRHQQQSERKVGRKRRWL